MYIYLHVPFCVSRCIYCDFYVVLEKYGRQAAYVDAVCREIELRFAALDLSNFAEGIHTLYVGGGTPSLLKADDYARIFKTLNRYLPFARDAEITLEANPGAHRSEMASQPENYRAVGFNRISVGVQSFNDLELKKLSRLHTVAEATLFIASLQRAGWQNISMDLMYGLPLQTLDSWRKTLAQAIGAGVQHISMYGLKIEENTPLETLTALRASAKKSGSTGNQNSLASYLLPEEDIVVDMYYAGLRLLQEAGFQRYEFSNLAKPGFQSLHNLNYWNNGDYLALGVSAHGYWKGSRYENVRDLSAYLSHPLAGVSTVCPLQERLENAIIFGLRKQEGIEIAALECEFEIDFQERYGAIIERYQERYLVLNQGRLFLTEAAIPLSNLILADFLA